MVNMYITAMLKTYQLFVLPTYGVMWSLYLDYTSSGEVDIYGM